LALLLHDILAFIDQVANDERHAALISRSVVVYGISFLRVVAVNVDTHFF
jgi:hypothetical protein